MGPSLYKIEEVGSNVGLVTRFQEVPSSNFDPQTSYSDRMFCCLLSLSRQIPGLYTKFGHDHFLSHPFQFSNSLIALTFEATQFKLLKVSLNKSQINKNIPHINQEN
jgi:hypothetical protein